MNTYFLLKHCCTDQVYSKDKPLSSSGKLQSFRLCNFLYNNNITQIYSSEKKRTYESVLYLSQKLKLPIIYDNRLNDKFNNNSKLLNYYDYMTNCFNDFQKKINNEESLIDVQKRTISFICDMQLQIDQNIVISTHGVCVALLINYFNGINAFDIWQHTKPGDLYKISFDINNVVVDKVKYL